jgi:hypothetical protein
MVRILLHFRCIAGGTLANAAWPAHYRCYYVVKGVTEEQKSIHGSWRSHKSIILV